MTDQLELPTSARLAVLGMPVSHSRSPRIHLAAYEALGLDWRYEAIERDAAGLEGFLGGLDEEWRGLSLTMPLKEEAHRLSAVLDPVAIESGVVNTLLHLPGRRWAGFNTDVGGLAAAVSNAGLDARSTVVIGSGATAISAILAARRLGAEHIELLARNIAAVSDLVARFGDSREPGAQAPLHVSGTNLEHPEALFAGHSMLGLPEPTLVISTLPGPASAAVTLPEELLAIPLFDVAYDPWPSPLAERWRESGGTAHSGLEMLVRQALLQIRIFIAGDPGNRIDREAELLTAMRLAAAGGVEE